MNFKISFVISILFLAAIVTARGNRRGKPGKNEVRVGGKKSLKSITTCLGEKVDLTNSLMSVDSCLQTKIAEVAATLGNATDDKSVRKREKKMKRISKKLRNKCMTECEWRALEMIPDGNTTSGTNGSSSVSDAAIKKFTEQFPEASREPLKTAVDNCIKTSPIMEPRQNFNMVRQTCSKYKKLGKCLERAVQRTCKATNIPVDTDTTASTMSTTPMPKKDSSSPGQARQDDDEEDDDDDDDADDDDDNQLTKSSTPFTPINLSTPITK